MAHRSHSPRPDKQRGWPSALAVLWAAGLLVLLQGCAQATASPRLVVNGVGRVEAVPDLAEFSLRVEAVADTAVAAQQVVEQRIAQILQVAAQHQLHDEQIDASQVVVRPDYRWEKQRRVYRGELVQRQVRLRLMDVTRYGSLIDALVGIQGIALDQVSLGFQDLKSHEHNALGQAVRDAQARARVAADAAGLSLGPLQRLEAVGGTGAIARPQVAALRADAEQAASQWQLRPQEIEQRVQLEFALESP
ncbi:MAG: SIMPL domain-containing protein [Pseudomonadota bacterium]|nr:SIMPL domain-containing protein [Pseudomonadota bacterium]